MLDPNTLEVVGAIAVAVGGALFGIRQKSKQIENQLKPINGTTETIRSEVHTISLSLLDLHRTLAQHLGDQNNTGKEALELAKVTYSRVENLTHQFAMHLEATDLG